MHLIALLYGCPESAESGDTSASIEEVSPNAPVVESASVVCYIHMTGETYTQWRANAAVSDQQGLSTIETIGALSMSDAGGYIGESPLACVDGECSASWRDDEFDVTCDTTAVATYDFSFTVTDVDGNTSAPLVVAGEKIEEP